MEIFVEKKKEKAKKGSKKFWWFLPRSKASEPGTVHVTLPFGDSGKSNKKKGRTVENSSGDTSNNGCHGNGSHLEIGEGSLMKKENPADLRELETRLDMETFTNNLWIEFENELKGVWPSSRNAETTAAPASTSAASNGELISNKISPPDANVSLASINQRCHGNEIANEKVERSRTVEVVNHVVKGKPPLPLTASLPSAQRSSRVKIGMPKISKKISAKEEVNDPSVMFDKLRQIAKEGRDRAAKSVHDLDEVQENFRFREEEKNNCHPKDVNKSPVGIKSLRETEEDEDLWSSTQMWGREHNYAGECPTFEKRWQESNQSLVGYLETDIDNFHSREVIHVGSSSSDVPGRYSPSRDRNVAPSMPLGSNVRKHRPVKLKTQSMFNLMNGADSRENVEEDAVLLTPEVDVDNVTSSPPDFRAKSMEFLLKAENKAAVEAPENRLMRLSTYRNGSGEENGYETPVVKSRAMLEHEERIRRSLQKLNLPEWYTNKINKLGSGDYLRRDGDERRSLRWEDYRNRSTSSSSVCSGATSASVTRTPNAVVIAKRVMAPDWRHVRSSRESLVQSPSSQTDASSNYGLSPWSRLSNNSSRSTSPTPGFNAPSVYRSSLKMPYLGWRSSEKLAALEKGSAGTVKQPEITFYRSAAERLSKGPGYYALRFGVYSSRNNFNGRDAADVSYV